MKVWPGECHVHAGIRTDDVTRMLDERPDADLLIHPECGCASQCMYAAAQDERIGRRTQVLSTEGMVKHAPRSPKREFVVATETGILHRLTREAPDKRFYAMSERAVCRYMKMITLEKLRDSLRDMRHVVTVDPDVAERARGAITPHGRDRLGSRADPRADSARVRPALPERLARAGSRCAGSAWRRPAPARRTRSRATAARPPTASCSSAQPGRTTPPAPPGRLGGRRRIGSAATASAPATARRAPLGGRARFRRLGRDRARRRRRAAVGRRRGRIAGRGRPTGGRAGTRAPPARRWRATRWPWPPGSAASGSRSCAASRTSPATAIASRWRMQEALERAAGARAGGRRDEAAPRPLDLPQRHVRVPRDPRAADRPARPRVRGRSCSTSSS